MFRLLVLVITLILIVLFAVAIPFAIGMFALSIVVVGGTYIYSKTTDTPYLMVCDSHGMLYILNKIGRVCILISLCILTFGLIVKLLF